MLSLRAMMAVAGSSISGSVIFDSGLGVVLDSTTAKLIEVTNIAKAYPSTLADLIITGRGTGRSTIATSWPEQEELPTISGSVEFDSGLETVT